MDAEQIDRTGLIREAYRIDGIGEAECRSIFLDWAIKLPEGLPPAEAIGVMLTTYGEPGHPMTKVLRDGLNAPIQTGRRGGARGRREA
jgi:hypothetical protein